MKFLLEWVKQNRILSTAIFILGTLLLAVLGNFLFEWVRDTVIPWLGYSTQPNYLVVILAILFGAFVGFLFGIILAANAIKQHPTSSYQRSIQNLNNEKMWVYWSLMADINTLIQRSLLARTNETLEFFIREYFYNIFEAMGSDTVRGGAIFLKKPNDPNILYYWSGSETKTEKSTKEFYIGKSSGKDIPPRGTAGTVFIEDRSIIVNILDQKDGDADEQTYYRFNKKPTSRYDSFVAIPIHWCENVVGVLSIESYERFTFKVEDLPMLQCIANRLGNILYHYNLIK